MSKAEISARSATPVVGRPFVPGRSGNPGRRPRAAVNVQELARAHTDEAIRTLVEALRDARLKVQAATALLDRGWGKPLQPLRDENGSFPGALHLLAAQTISDKLADLRRNGTLVEAPVIDGSAAAEPTDWRDAPRPTE